MSNSTELADRAIALYNAGDIDGFIAMCAEDAVLSNPEGTFQGRDAVRAYWTQEKKAFPDGKVTTGLTIEQGDTVVGEFTWTGTQTGPMAMPDGTELPPTGKRVELKGMELIQVRDGEVIRHDLYWDNMATITQLGLAPAAT